MAKEESISQSYSSELCALSRDESIGSEHQLKEVSRAFLVHFEAESK